MEIQATRKSGRFSMTASKNRKSYVETNRETYLVIYLVLHSFHAKKQHMENAMQFRVELLRASIS